jgi:hypothetical protein
MATQRLMVATLAGKAAIAVSDLFARWRATPDPVAVDELALALREHGYSLPVVSFSEWVDRWLMGDLVPGPGAVRGQHVEATCLGPLQAVAWAGPLGHSSPEQRWLAARPREAAAGWEEGTTPCAVVVVREVLGPSATDEEVRLSLGCVPPWLGSF